MKKAFLLFFLFTLNSVGFATTVFNQCVNLCEREEVACLRDCSCRATDKTFCTNSCVTKTTRCHTLCKVQLISKKNALPTTALPNGGSNLNCQLAPANYLYW